MENITNGKFTGRARRRSALAALALGMALLAACNPVSYTHLDVYKRQS